MRTPGRLDTVHSLAIFAGAGSSHTFVSQLELLNVGTLNMGDNCGIPMSSDLTMLVAEVTHMKLLAQRIRTVTDVRWGHMYTV